MDAKKFIVWYESEDGEDFAVFTAFCEEDATRKFHSLHSECITEIREVDEYEMNDAFI